MTDTDNDRPRRVPEPAGKARWRAELAARRAAIGPGQQVSEAHALAGKVAELTAGTVCCYVPFGSEPGAITLLDVLREAGARVLLPIVPPAPGPLDWAEYTGTSSLVTGRFKGVLEPDGPRLGPRALATVDRILLPALAVDHSGVRLGRGAGYYDRSLPLAAATTDLVAVIRDTELVPSLPAESHDVRMNAALTPGEGLIRLPLGN
ncbi:5-formyltetrahydrofolate cyclo-ligase [Prauserella marina]|uniref:5-formyltetrahydrofolate cyclo-ligase n=1 Tax=Prauserella marina TaxID=530584 RepID=UPI000B83D9B3|nr:5-formyltetrahydrofolate cyclo-ligase [Prauserella marina]ASR38114.1 5-formyltetrahydrofolate cyclo-ligase [Prauserella marina]